MIKCCGRLRDGKYCSECGIELANNSVIALRKQLREARRHIKFLVDGIYFYVDCYHKEIAGSTIQYSIRELERLLEYEEEEEEEEHEHEFTL